jgi:hypothetical protein
MSCIQIRNGYPAYTLHHRILFTRASKTRLYIFKIYRAIPFVAELEVLLDWVSTDTSLDLFGKAAFPLIPRLNLHRNVQTGGYLLEPVYYQGRVDLQEGT